MNSFRVGLTRDFLNASGEVAMGDIGLETLKATPGLIVEFLPEFLPEVSKEQVACYDALISLAPRYTRETFSRGTKLSVLARVGVGYDMVDVPALTENDVILTITPDGVRRPMATAVLTLLLAVTHQLVLKDKLVRDGRWKERTRVGATGLTGRVFGAIGLGNIGSEVLRLLAPLDMAHLASDPFVTQSDASDLRVEMVDLETLMRRSDFVSLHCPLTEETRGMIGAREISWMKPTSYLINASRGALVDQSALYAALKEGKIRGAALDVFEVEPVPAGEKLLTLDNVIVTPHSLCWTDECFRRMGESAIASVLTVFKGEIPTYVVNREVLVRPRLTAKLTANRHRWDMISKESAHQ